jgi:hypothetical protein
MYPVSFRTSSVIVRLSISHWSEYLEHLRCSPRCLSLPPSFWGHYCSFGISTAGRRFSAQVSGIIPLTQGCLISIGNELRLFLLLLQAWCWPLRLRLRLARRLSCLLGYQPLELLEALLSSASGHISRERSLPLPSLRLRLVWLILLRQSRGSARRRLIHLL